MSSALMIQFIVPLLNSHLLLKTPISISLHFVFLSSCRKESLILCVHGHYAIQNAGLAPTEGDENLTGEQFNWGHKCNSH